MYHRSGVYPVKLPSGLGSEAAGVVEVVGVGVARVAPGDRAAWRGLIVSYGNAGGKVSGVELGVLAAKGSLFVTRPMLFDYYVTPKEKQAGTDRLFAMLRKRAITAEIGQTFALEDAAEAHRALEAGETRGATVLLP